MTPHSSTLAWKIPWTEEPGGLQPMGSQESDTTEWLHFHFSLIGEGNGNPLHCSCLENPRDDGAWWAMGSHRVRHDWSDLAAVTAAALWYRSTHHINFIFSSLIYRNLKGEWHHNKGNAKHLLCSILQSY